MDCLTECPICYKKYGEQTDDGNWFLCKDGIDNSNFRDTNPCKHYFCVCCLKNMFNHGEVPYTCPLCRSDITEWLEEGYNDDDDDDDDDDDE